jgi:protein-L-isoaspartate(D-aspartate) O-methyltransferase
MVDLLAQEGIQNRQVLQAMRNTPRHIFVDEALQSRAYENTALPIGFGQTISQPYIVARMTEVLLEDGIPERVLEVGTGSGYQAAVLAQLVPKVYSVERIGNLLHQARKRFRLMKLKNVHVQHVDGTMGWPERSPFGGIILTACPDEIPQPLLDQLAIGGRLVAPVGETGNQMLILIKRLEDRFEQTALEPVSFVLLLSGYL